MSDLLTHIAQAKHNQNCAAFLLEKGPLYYDWAITAAFYAAVHYAEACFDADSANHEERRDKIRSEAKGAFNSYQKLFTASWNVRYLVAGKGIVATKLYTLDNARAFLQKDLIIVRDELQKAYGYKLT